MRIPVRSTAQIQPTNARATTQASPDMFGAAAGRALQGVSREVDAAAQRWDQMQDEKAAADARLAYARMNDALRERMSGENGYLTQTGQNAIDGYDQFEDDIERLRSEISGELDPRARDAFEQLAVRRRESALNSAAAHQARERQTYQAQASEAYVAARREEAISQWTDPQAFGETLAIGSRDIRIQGQQAGQPGEATDLQVAEYESGAVLTAISAAVDSGALDQAEALRDMHGDRLTGEHRATVARVMETADLSRRRQEAVDEVFSRFGTDEAAGLRHIRETYGGDLEDEAVRDYKARVGEAQMSATQQREGLVNQAISMVQGGTPVDSLPLSMWSALESEEREFIRNRQNGTPQSTDWRVYDQYAEMSPADLARVDLSRARRELAGPEYNRVEGWVRSARDGELDVQETDFIRTERDIINMGMDTAGVDRTDPDKRRRFEDGVERARTAFQRQNSREPDDAELQAMVDALTADVVTGRGIFGGDVTGPVPASLEDARRGGRQDYANAIANAFQGSEADDTAREALYQRVLAEYAARGVTPSAAEVERGIAYLRRNEAR